MNYKLVFTGKTVPELKAILDNWKWRLDGLTGKYGHPIDQMTNKKAERLIFHMIDRMVAAASAFTDAKDGLPLSEFPRRAIATGVSINPETLEIVISYPPEHVRPEQRN